MFWLVVIASGAGVLLGLRLRAPSVLAASVAIVLASLVLMPFGQWSFVAGTMFTVALLTALQFGYLVGLVLLSAWTRANPQRTADLPS
jgi:hypothetical protein